MPLSISVVTAVLNRVATIGQTLASVQGQTWPWVEHIVIDGASTDGTVEVLEAQRNRLAVLVSEPDTGIYDALNKGQAQALGDVIGFLHSDDLYADNDVLERVARTFDDPMIDGVYGDLDYVSREDPSRIVRRWRAGVYNPRRLGRGWMPPHPTLHLRRSVIGKWGGFDTDFSVSGDYDAILRYLTRGRIRLAYIPEVLVKMRVGGESNRIALRLLHKSREDYAALRKNGVGGIGALIWKNVSKLPQFLMR